MKTNIFLAALAAFSTTAGALALPYISVTDALASSSPLEQAMGNLSSMFGWQLAGSGALSSDQLTSTCADLASTGHGQWAAEGLNPANIQDPICTSSSNSASNATTAVPYALLYSTNLFITQLLNAFDSTATDTFAYLCIKLRFLQLDGFYLGDARIVNATCAAAGKQLPARPEGPLAKINTNATTAYFNTASILYALLFASSATTVAELDGYCADASQYVSGLDTLLLNGTLVESTLCGLTEVLTADVGAAAIRTWTTRMFITVLENVSNVGGWLERLCGSLDVAGLESVGLDGLAVQTQVCADAQG